MRRSEAFVWLSVVGLLLLWSTLPVGVALGGMFDCFGNDDQCRAAVDRQATAATISNAVLIAFTGVTVAAVIVGRHQLPVVLLAMSISALVLGLVSLITRGGLSPWVPAGFWVTIPPPSCSRPGRRDRSAGMDAGPDCGTPCRRTHVRFVLRLVD